MKRQYQKLLPIIRVIAKEHGYAIGLHGSTERDLDLIAAPWIANASTAETLAEAVRAAVNGHISAREGANPTVKPHGRLAWAIRPLDNNPHAELYIDLSVMPVVYS